MSADTLPPCMMPDGGDCCPEFRSLSELSDERFREIKRAQDIIDGLRGYRELAVAVGGVLTAEQLGSELKALRRVAQAAHDLLCWTYQHAITTDPDTYSRNIKDLHPGAWNTMNSAERDLYSELRHLNDALADIDRAGVTP